MPDTNDISTEEKRWQIDEWKKLYLSELINRLSPQGSVLQIGFHTDFCADQVQKHSPSSHTIVEANDSRILSAEAWARQHDTASVIHGSWQSKMATLGKFDTILIVEPPCETELELLNRLFPQDLTAASDEARTQLEDLQKVFSQTKQPFSDADLQSFYEKVGQFNLEHLPRFFESLLSNGNISSKQYRESMSKLQLDKDGGDKRPLQQHDPRMDMISQGLEHLHTGGRLSCFLAQSDSLYENPNFFDEVITNPRLDYQEDLVNIEVPNALISSNEAVIMRITKVQE